MSNQNQRTAPIYLISGIMTLICMIFGGFFLVWCGTLRFLFTNNTLSGFVLLIFPGLIAWMSYEAARSAWMALPEAPLQAIRALAVLGLFIMIAEALMFSLGEISGFSIWLVVPYIVLAGLVWVVYWLSHHFRGHLIEIDTPVVEEQPYGSDHSENDDDDWMYLGGA